MAIKSISFSGNLSDDNTLKVNVDETYCSIRSGHWRVRFDSLIVSPTKNDIKVQVSLSCSIFKSPSITSYEVRDYSANREGIVTRTKTSLGPTPLHSFWIDVRRNNHLQLLKAGQTEWFHFSNYGYQVVTLYFTDNTIDDEAKRTTMNLFVSGILYLAC